MADKNDSSGGKPGNTAASDKKPKPLLDLKATEVRSSSDSAAKPQSPTSNLKGAPNWKDPKSTAQSSGSSSSKSDGQSGAGNSQPTSTAARMASAAPPPERSGSAKPSESQRSEAQPSGAQASVTKATDGKVEGSKPGPAKAENAKPAAKPPGGDSGSKPAAVRSGGGFASTVSHLAAGVVGGGIALFAAGPLDQQLGLGLSQAPAVPAAIEQRLAALESRPVAAAGGNDGLKEDVAALSGKVEAAEKRLAELDALGKQVASLTEDVAAARNAAPSGGAGDTATEKVAGPSELRARLAKLESALATLASATGGNGQPAGIAPLAQFSAKLADLESSLNAQLASLRKGLLGEMDTRIAATSEASTKAAASAERLNREVSDIKTDTARLEQRSVVLKSASDKLAATARAVSEQAAELKVELDALKGNLNQELAKVARPADLENAIAPVSAKIASIEKNLGSVIASETARKENAERIVLSLELSNLKRVLDRGTPYAAELADVKKVAGDAIDFSALEAHKSDGVPSGQALTRQFSKVAFDIINAQNAPKDDTRINRLLAAAKSIVQVRRTDVPVKENTAEAAVARIEKRLKDGDMSGALSLAEKLPDEAKAPAKDWMSRLAARAGVDRAIAQIENQLKASLGSGATKDKS